YSSLEDLRKNLDRSYKSSKLSPFPCRIREGKYRWKGKDFEFRNKFMDGSAIHGLLFNKDFAVVKEFSNHSMASITLNYQYRNDDPAYPHDYDCEIIYSLYPSQTLQVQTRLINKGQEDLPIADGWHPYFRLGGTADEWVMHFETEAMIEFDKHLVPTGRLIPFEPFNPPAKIGATEMDNCFKLKIPKDIPACELFNPINKLKISFYPGIGYPYLQVYIPPHRKTVAIENLSAPPDCFNNKMGLTVLKPGASENLELVYKLSIV
ncbi:MAG: aldose 1-epimerase, partial [Chitinophagales bacterium]